MFLTKLRNHKSKSNHKTVCSALLNHSKLSYIISLESTHLELSNDTRIKYVELIINGPFPKAIFLSNHKSMHGVIINGLWPFVERFNIATTNKYVELINSGLPHLKMFLTNHKLRKNAKFQCNQSCCSCFKIFQCCHFLNCSRY